MITGKPKPKPATQGDLDALAARVRDLEAITVFLAQKAGVKTPAKQQPWGTPHTEAPIK